jgi:hypothetical protein
MAFLIAIFVFYFAFRHIHFNLRGRVGDWMEELKDEREAYLERQNLRSSNDWFKKNGIKVEEEI